MPALRELEVENFLSLRSVSLPLGPLNVLVGPNAAGKSNLIDVVAFLRDAVRSDLRPALDARGGFDRVRYRGVGSRGSIRIRLEAQVTSHSSASAPDEYTLEISQRRMPRSERFVLRRSEDFRFKRTRGRGRRLTIRGKDLQVFDDETKAPQEQPLLQSESLGLATLPRLSDEAGGRQVREIAALFRTFRVFDVDVARARQPKSVLDGSALADDGSNLAAFLLRLSGDSDRWEALQKDLQEIVPGVRRLHLRLISSGEEETAVLELEEAGLRGRTLFAEASYGTVRALALLAVLHDPEPPPLTCIEEFDHGLHPYAFDVLVERLREAASRTQILIATHSPALVNRLEAGELIIVERDHQSGASIIPALSAEKVRAMEEALEGRLGLGELWFSGSLGGVPDL